MGVKVDHLDATPADRDVATTRRRLRTQAGGARAKKTGRTQACGAGRHVFEKIPAVHRIAAMTLPMN
jgi:hypothetical protein